MNEEFEKVTPIEGQVEEGIEYNPVTTDNTLQDEVNEDTAEEMNDEGTVIAYGE